MEGVPRAYKISTPQKSNGLVKCSGGGVDIAGGEGGGVLEVLGEMGLGWVVKVTDTVHEYKRNWPYIQG